MNLQNVTTQADLEATCTTLYPVYRRIASAPRIRTRPKAATNQSCSCALHSITCLQESMPEPLWNSCAPGVRPWSEPHAVRRQWAQTVLDILLTHFTNVRVSAQLLWRLNAKMLSVHKWPPRARTTARGITCSVADKTVRKQVLKKSVIANNTSQQTEPRPARGQRRSLLFLQ